MIQRLLPILLVVGCTQQGTEEHEQELEEPIQGSSLIEVPNQSALGGVSPDPAAVASARGEGAARPRLDGALPITFAHLSMAGADVNGLIDLMFTEDPDGAEFEFPESIQELDGEDLTIVGYMIALDFEGEAVTHFMLVRDLAACCFGGIPRPDEWIDVHVTEPCPYWVYRPVRVRGHLSVGLEQQEDALMTSVLQIKDATASMEE